VLPVCDQGSYSCQTYEIVALLTVNLGSMSVCLDIQHARSAYPNVPLLSTILISRDAKRSRPRGGLDLLAFCLEYAPQTAGSSFFPFPRITFLVTYNSLEFCVFFVHLTRLPTGLVLSNASSGWMYVTLSSVFKSGSDISKYRTSLCRIK
jgi:hypothetical protein